MSERRTLIGRPSRYWRLILVAAVFGPAVVACDASSGSSLTGSCPSHFQDVVPSLTAPSVSEGGSALRLPDFDGGRLCIYKGGTGVYERSIPLSSQSVPPLRQALKAATYEYHSMCAAPAASIPDVIADLSYHRAQAGVVSIELSGCRFIMSQNGQANVSDEVSSTVMNLIR